MARRRPADAHDGKGHDEKGGRVRVIALDLDTDPCAGGVPALTAAEAEGLRVLLGLGCQVVIFTAASFGAVAGVLAEQGIRACAWRDALEAGRRKPETPHVLAVSEMGGAACAGRAGCALAEVCRWAGAAFSDAACVAVRPGDAETALEAGTLVALEGAGYRLVAAADAVFPARACGGLVQALRWLACVKAGGAETGRPA